MLGWAKKINTRRQIDPRLYSEFKNFQLCPAETLLSKSATTCSIDKNHDYATQQTKQDRKRSAAKLATQQDKTLCLAATIHYKHQLPDLDQLPMITQTSQDEPSCSLPCQTFTQRITSNNCTLLTDTWLKIGLNISSLLTTQQQSMQIVKNAVKAAVERKWKSTDIETTCMDKTHRITSSGINMYSVGTTCVS